MNQTFIEATHMLSEAIGQNKIATLATKNGDGVACRTVNLYSYKNRFYFVTEQNSNKFQQIEADNQVACSVDAIQMTGVATPLAHPCDASNQEIIHAIEEKLPQHFARHQADGNMRLIQIEPKAASFILLSTGKGFCVQYSAETATPIAR